MSCRKNYKNTFKARNKPKFQVWDASFDLSNLSAWVLGFHPSQRSKCLET